MRQSWKVNQRAKIKNNWLSKNGCYRVKSQQQLDFGGAVLELKAAAKAVAEIAQKFQSLIDKIKSWPSAFNQFVKLAEIKPQKCDRRRSGNYS